MFYINQTTQTFLFAKQEHYKNVRFVIKKKLLGEQFQENHPKGTVQRIQKVPGISSRVAGFLNDEHILEAILIGSPEKLYDLSSEIRKKRDIESVNKIIRYDAFIKKGEDTTFRHYSGYNLAANLQQNTCVYCNRLYTQTIISERKEFITRPTFDHWYPKSQFPLLALSFFNLIPSCSICNSTIKGANTLSLEDIFHPYLQHTEKERQLNFKFTYNLDKNLQAHSKILTGNGFSEKSIEVMKLRDLYNSHKEELNELIYLKKAYSESYLESLQQILKIQLLPSEIYRLAFGTYFEDGNFHKRPLSKFKRDILVELGIVR